METIRLGLLGLGWWGGVLADSARKSGAAEVMASFSRSPETRAKFTEEHGGRAVDDIDSLLADEDIEGVLIATPHTTHGDLVIQVASAGKHVFVEKPLTLTVDEGRRAIAATEQAGVVLDFDQARDPFLRFGGASTDHNAGLAPKLIPLLTQPGLRLAAMDR